VKGGMNVTGEIVINEADGVLTIPMDALRRDEQGWYVYLSDGSTQNVEIGIMTDSRVEIISGLAEGQEVTF